MSATPSATVAPSVSTIADGPTARMYSELRFAYDFFNEHLFGNALPGCMLTLQREKRSVGYFSAKRFGDIKGVTADEIAINPEWFAVTPLVETLQTLAHEMTHQWQEHFGKPARGRYHNTEWAAKMESIGLRPHGPDGKRVGDAIGDKPIPGGRFLAAVDELVSKQGFGLSWFDRLTPVGAAAGGVLRAERELAGTAVAALFVAAEHGLAVQVRAEAKPSDGDAMPVVRPTSSGERVKYRCPGKTDDCGAVWGRGGLRLMCKGCKEDLTPVDGKARQRRGHWGDEA
jgi:hypothetical protein